MRTFAQVFKVKEFRKKYFYPEGGTETHLERGGWTVPGAGNFDAEELSLYTPDDQTPNHRQVFLVTVEPVEVPEGMHISDFIEKEVPKILASRAEIVAGLKTGRKFR